MVSTKKSVMYDMAVMEAEKSTSLYRLGAVIAKGKKVLCTGHNHDRSRILGCHECHAHAEMDAASRYLHQQGIYDIPWHSLKGRYVEGA